MNHTRFFIYSYLLEKTFLRQVESFIDIQKRKAGNLSEKIDIGENVKKNYLCRRKKRKNANGRI